MIHIFDIEFTRLIMVSYGVRDFEKNITHLYESNKYLCHEDHMDNLPAYNSEKKRELSLLTGLGEAMLNL